MDSKSIRSTYYLFQRYLVNAMFSLYCPAILFEVIIKQAIYLQLSEQIPLRCKFISITLINSIKKKKIRLKY